MMLCTCLAESNVNDCLKVAKSIDTDIVEHRIDYLNDIYSLEILYRSIAQPVISTVRPEWEGGLFTGSEESRLEMLNLAMDAGCAAIDVEHSASEWFKEMAMGKAKKTSTIVISSKHYFENTPDLPILISLISSMKQEGADLGKIITTARDIRDCETIAKLQRYANSIGFPLVTFAMGEKGLISRVASIRLGSPFTYVSIGKKTALGQVSADIMRLLLEEGSV